MKQNMNRCNCCNKVTLHVGESTNHILHLILSIISFGIWIPIWVLQTIRNSGAGDCTVCGGEVAHSNQKAQNLGYKLGKLFR